MDSKHLENHFSKFREHIIGQDHIIETPEGKKKLIYADWIASGRLYEPIETRFSKEIAPLVANTHTETNFTGSSMTHAYHKATEIIKEHVGAHQTDVLISAGSGMTGVVNKLQRILGLKIHEKYYERISLSDDERPVIFITHMEHHSNQTSWLETIADIKIIDPNKDGLVDLNHFQKLLDEYKDRPLKIAAITSCSNVTGIFTPFHEIAKMIHKYGGYCFVDFACSAPYIDINMRPDENEEHLDAIYFSPHKFLGGPGTTGILVFDPKLYKNKIPDNPGGGTVEWTNPWGEHKYFDNIEAREDGGTPPFIQTLKVAFVMQLKKELDTKMIKSREEEILDYAWNELIQINNLHILADNIKDRLSIISFYIDDLHYNLVVKLLNDKYGIQVRGGCSCAGTYGHYLLHVQPEVSKNITDRINKGDLSMKPGWVRLSLHPTMTNDEVTFIVEAIKSIAKYGYEWKENYIYELKTNEFYHKNEGNVIDSTISKWFAPFEAMDS